MIGCFDGQICCELFLSQNTLWERDFIKSQENCQVCWITRTVEMQRNLPPGTMLYRKIKYYRENPHEVPESCRASVIAEARKLGEIPQASTDGRYPHHERYGQFPYEEAVYQPTERAVASGSGTYSYTQNQRPVHDTGYADSGYNQHTSQPSGSRYPGGQQYVTTSEHNIVTAEPRHQERTPAPHDNRASVSRPSKKGKEHGH
ncbi:hypothetical protein BOTCAL_0510g00050 [Botryotinia calthae]|uniref:Uncharacterized protein n=1 Tax=Botryotinia calthae TaxID=38488 RepID=A0A4Y8CNC5_9HELO|nr:hypothetical protein BOTCAL_0510g00050 [Botryotinia calthae]